MIGLVLIPALIVWIVLTILAMMFFRRILRRISPNLRLAGMIGMFIGFMLIMGGWFVYWGIEYLQIRSYVNEMCKQTGITVFISPEEWKNRIGGEDVWKNIEVINRNPTDDIKDEFILFKGNKYTIYWQYNDLVYVYTRYQSEDYTTYFDHIYYDRKNQIMLFRYNYITVQAGTVGNPFEGLKFWIAEMDSCPQSQLANGLITDFVNFKEKE
ncbi:hypothetical protein [Eikenella sp. Marseille-P7795]|uniref:hypothetical protein n=1 Tax=Eikenella sp. Marseille-P7795 TaxID=2866577 RepID=UPI001CE48854|nr:hypothetical protein [Eikenella sp. Marseille-P7795]